MDINSLTRQHGEILGALFSPAKLTKYPTVYIIELLKM